MSHSSGIRNILNIVNVQCTAVLLRLTDIHSTAILWMLAEQREMRWLQQPKAQPDVRASTGNRENLMVDSSSSYPDDLRLF